MIYCHNAILFKLLLFNKMTFGPRRSSSRECDWDTILNTDPRVNADGARKCYFQSPGRLC